MKKVGILFTQVLVFTVYAIACLSLIRDKAAGGILMAILIGGHSTALFAYGAVADPGSNTRWQYFLSAIFVVLVGPSMCVTTVFR